MAVDRNKLIQEADKLVRQGKIDKAIALFEQALEAGPKDMNLKVKVGDLYLKIGDTGNAVRTLLEVGGFYAEEGFYLKAIAIYKRINKTDPSSIDVYYKLADLYAKQGLNNDAKSQYQQVADLYLKSGNAAKAAEALAQMVKLDPENAKIRVRLAEMEAKQGRSREAVAEYLAVGQLFQKKGMLEEAVKVAYDPGLALDDSNAELAAGLLKTLFDIGKFEELIARGRTLYSKQRENVPFLASMAEAYLRSGQQDMARTAFEKLEALDPENEAWKERLGVLRSGKKPAAATPAATPAVSAPVAHGGGNQLPDLSEMSGDYSMAELEEVSGDWKAASDLSPDSAEGATTASADSEKDEFVLEHMTEAEVFIKYGLVEKAIDNLEAIVSHYPDEVETLRRLKDLYLEAGNKTKAAEKCVSLATVARSRGEMQKAMDLLSEARAHDPSVRVERAAPQHSTEAAPASGEDYYAFGAGEVAAPTVDLEPGPPASGIELEFEMPGSGGEGAVSGRSPQGGSVADYPSGGDGGGDGIEFSIDEGGASSGEDEGIAIELEGDEAPAAGAGSDAAAEPEEGELAEADFYAEQGFAAEAKTRLDTLRSRFPHSQRVRERLERLKASTGGAEEEVAVGSGGGGEEEFQFDPGVFRPPVRDAGDSSAPLPFESQEAPIGAEESDQSLFDGESDFLKGAESPAAETSTPGAAPTASGVGEESLEEIFKEFKEKVEASVPAEDYETHYDLGVAYLETGLIDEAISEFQVASKDPNKFIGCCTNLGMCFRQKGMPKLAVKWYQKAVESLDGRQESPEYIGSLYELGHAHKEAGDKEAALEAFTNVLGLDASYRDVMDLVDELSQ